MNGWRATLNVSEQIYLQILCSYISAGSRGMPAPERLVELTRETVDLALKDLGLLEDDA